VERIIARVEAGPQGADTRFIVSNLEGGRAKARYEEVYCRRGMAENLIKSWKTHLAADRTSCTRATANRFRLCLHAGACWLMWGVRAAMPRRSRFSVAQFDTLCLRLIKIAETQIRRRSGRTTTTSRRHRMARSSRCCTKQNTSRPRIVRQAVAVFGAPASRSLLP
jgi:hypothetical protein